MQARAASLPAESGPDVWPASDIWLGDLVRAVRVLELDDAADIRSVAALLGLAPQRTAPGQAAEDPVETIPGSISQIGTVGAERRTGEPSDPGHSETRPQAGQRVPALLERVEAPPADAGFLVGIQVLDSPGGGLPAPEPSPLLPPHYARVIAVSAAARSERSGSIDAPRLVAMLAACQPVERIPRRTRLSVRRGADVLIDRGEGMNAFVHDRRQLTQRILAVAGAQRTRVLGFVGTPERGAGTGPRSRWRSYRPLPGVPVVLLTDLGLAWGAAEAASPAEWLAWLRATRARDRPVTAFVPYPRSRIPAQLLAALPVLEWDVTMSPSSVRRVLRGHR